MIHFYMHNVAIQCPSLESIENGMISYSTTATNQTYIFRTVAAFSCSPGFGLSSSHTRVCVGDSNSSEAVGRFNGSAPSCEGKERTNNNETVILMCFLISH